MRGTVVCLRSDVDLSPSGLAAKSVLLPRARCFTKIMTVSDVRIVGLPSWISPLFYKLFVILLLFRYKSIF